MYKNLIVSAINNIERSNAKRATKKEPQEMQQMEILIFGQTINEIERKEREKEKQKKRTKKNIFKGLANQNKLDRKFFNRFKIK
jgi:hypothetical protein